MKNFPTDRHIFYFSVAHNFHTFTLYKMTEWNILAWKKYLITLTFKYTFWKPLKVIYNYLHIYIVFEISRQSFLNTSHIWIVSSSRLGI